MVPVVNLRLFVWQLSAGWRGFSEDLVHNLLPDHRVLFPDRLLKVGPFKNRTFSHCFSNTHGLFSIVPNNIYKVEIGKVGPFNVAVYTVKIGGGHAILFVPR